VETAQHNADEISFASFDVASQDIGKEEEKRRQQICDFCGKDLVGEADEKRSKPRKYCSKNCQTKANRGWQRVRLDLPISTRQMTKLRFSNSLYFD
jgi:hypothetical protein